MQITPLKTDLRAVEACLSEVESLRRQMIQASFCLFYSLQSRIYQVKLTVY